MKSVKIISLLLAVLMMGMMFVACGGDGKETEAESNADVVDRDPINVNIIVKDSEDGVVKYASDENTGYDFEGETATPLAILEEFMDFQYSVVITYDDTGKLQEVGDLKAGDGHLWLWSLAKAPKTADLAEPMDANLDEYTGIENGDTIVIYLS